jgi:ATP-dependent Clp protease ATP-binding subunit ClpA
LPITNDLREVLEHAISVADVQQCREVRTEHLFDALFEHGGHVSKMLRDFGLEDTAIKSLLKKVDCCKPQRPTAAARQAMSSVLGKMF